MIYPAQTSLIPVQVALARFVEQGGPSASSGFYPYWYLGTTPFRYLTGPILPLVLALIHRLVPNVSLFEIMFGVIGVSWVIGGIGVYLLVRSLANSFTPALPAGRSEESLSAFADASADKRATIRGVLAAIFYLFGPIVPFLFRFSDGLYLIAFSFLPYILLLYLLQLRKHRMEQKHRIEVLLCILIAFVILLDSLIIPSLLLGMAAVFLVQVGWKRAEEKLKQSLWLMAYSLLLATLWYTPGYWLTLLGAPSLGGMGVVRVIGWLGKLLPTALALGIAIFSVKFFKKRNLLRDFCFYWLFIFGFLTLVRFLSDPDFWLDWTSYGTELQMGLGIALGVFFEDRRQKSEDGFRRQMTEGRQKICFPFSVFRNLSSVFSFRSSVFFALYFLLFATIFNRHVLGTFQQDITRAVEYRISKQLSEIAKPGERVFLSGSTAFWLNAFFDIPQVRGGKDEASVHPTWRQAVWEIRQGQDLQKSLGWLKKLGVEYLVVHTKKSGEFYHDFSNPEKFEGVEELEKVYDEGGDKIYKLED